jgi:O-methyltransferase
MAVTLSQMNIEDRKIFLFDTFEGMTEPSKHDKDDSGLPASRLLEKADKGNGENIWCIASIEDVKNNFDCSGYPEEMVQLVKGDVGITLKDERNLPKEIAVLRLDTDWYESTKIELEVLFPRLVKGGVCLIDDYGHWQGARKAVDEYLQKNSSVRLNRVDL